MPGFSQLVYSRKLALQILLSSFAFMIVLMAATILFGEIELVLSALIWEFFAIVTLIAISGELAARPRPENGRVVKYSNYFATVISFIIAILLILKILSHLHVLSVNPEWFANLSSSSMLSVVASFLMYIYNKLHLLTGLPVILYFLINLYILLMPGKYEASFVGRVERYFWFSSVPCFVSLSIMIFLVAMAKNEQIESEIFVGGGMSIIILMSAFLTSAVHVFNTDDHHP